MGRERGRRLEELQLQEAREVEDEIRERAYERYMARASSGREGDEFLDWLAAEAEVLDERGTPRG